MLQNPDQYTGNIAELEKYATIAWHDFIICDFITLVNTNENMDIAITSLVQAKADDRTALNAQNMSVSDSPKLFQTSDDRKARRAVISQSASAEQYYQLLARYCDRYFFPHANTIMKVLTWVTRTCTNKNRLKSAHRVENHWIYKHYLC